MEDNTFRIQTLFDRYTEGIASEAEIREFFALTVENEHDQQLKDLLLAKLESSDQVENYLPERKLRMFDRINAEVLSLGAVGRVHRTGSSLWGRIAIAASVVAVLGAGLLYDQHHKRADRELAFERIKPGGNKAYLTLSGGKRIALTDALNGVLVKESGVEISKTAEGELVYRVVGGQDTGVAGDGQNMVETPKGGQYQLLLPDGTRVWLNAASRLTYPVSFASKIFREVQLSGEGYFEVAKDKAHPFIVESKGQRVEVLGTHFNVNNYADEPSVKTTLLEGSVRVNERTVLSPGEQAVSSGGGISVRKVDAESFVDWKNGEFVFVDEPLPSIMRKLSRWYNVEVEYLNPEARGITFTGSVSRFDNVSGILKALQQAAKVRFVVSGNKISVE